MPFVDDTPPQPRGQFVDDTPAQPRGQFVDTPPSASNSDAIVERYAKQYGVPLDFANRIRQRESGGTADPATATSGAGARGVFQLLPGTFKEQGVGDNIEDPEQNIHAGIKYLAQQLQRYHGDEQLAAAAYNAGPGAVDKYHGVPPFKETQAYVQATAAPPQGHFADTAPHLSAQQTSNADQYKAPKMNPLQQAEHASLMAGTNVMRGADAVLGAPQRLVAGLLTGDPGAMLDPWNDARQARLQTKTNSLPVVQQVAGTIGTGAGAIGGLTDQVMKLVGHPTHNADFLKKVGTTMAAQIITDPLTLVPVVGELEAANRVRQGLDVAAKAARGAVPGLDQALKDVAEYHDATIKPFTTYVFGVRPGLNPYLTTEGPVNGKAARLSIEEHNIDKQAQELQPAYDMLRRHEAQIRSAKTWDELPPEIQQQSLREAWRHGTDDMRAKAEELGFDPTHEDRALFPEPEGILNYNPREDYVTLIDPKGKKYEQMPFLQGLGEKSKEEFAGFEKHARADQPVFEDMYDRIKNRWRLGANVVRQRRIDRDTKDFLLNYGGSKIQATPANVDTIVKQLDYSPKQYFLPWTRAVKELSRAGVQLNPLPHGLKNMGELASLAGGPEAFGNGMRYTAQGLSDEQKARLSRMGVSADYLRHGDGKLEDIFNKISQPQQALLTRMELGYRQARLDQLDKELGYDPNNLALEYQKAQRIRDDLSDYRNISRFVAVIQALGGPFVAFRLGIAPKAVGSALAKNPARVNASNRAATDVNEELRKEGQPGTFHFADPIEDFDKLSGAGGLDQVGKFLTSAATIGPVASALFKMLFQQQPIQTAAKQSAEELTPALRELLPLIDQIPGARHWLQQQGLQYRDPGGLSAMNDALNAMLGTYFQTPPSASTRRAIERKSRQ